MNTYSPLAIKYNLLLGSFLTTWTMLYKKGCLAFASTQPRERIKKRGSFFSFYYSDSSCVNFRLRVTLYFPNTSLFSSMVLVSNSVTLANAKTMLTAAASFAATVMVARSVAEEFLPSDFHDRFQNFFKLFSSQLTMVIEESTGNFDTNKIYEAAETYLATKISPRTQRIKVRKSDKEGNIITTIDAHEEVIDTFNGIKLHWIFKSNRVKTDNHGLSNRVLEQSFELSFHRKHIDMVLNSYLPYIVKQAEDLRLQTRTLKIFSVKNYNNIKYNGSSSHSWVSTNLDHPTTFDKVAMDTDIKDFILKDLERFVKRKEFYKNVGKAWKRGYLLYGPPGTGKSSLIAAIANYLKFNVYDLELTELESNSDVRKLLMGMENRSILVVEDIDCTIEFRDRNAESEPEPEPRSSQRRKGSVTLSGLLNLIDGLWSSCGDERIIIFTTNHKEKLDPALLRPGRMDVHIHMSYCSPCGFRILASNYLGIKDHKLFSTIEELILSIKVTPAEVAEELLKANDHDNALNDLIEFLKVKKE